jgi:hypothetical protein
VTYNLSRSPDDRIKEMKRQKNKKIGIPRHYPLSKNPPLVFEVDRVQLGEDEGE